MRLRCDACSEDASGKFSSGVGVVVAIEDEDEGESVGRKRKTIRIFCLQRC